jgi:hypothetical protein
MSIVERLRGILARASDPRGAADRVAAILRDGKREQLLAGVDADGRPFAPLAASTLRRKGRRDPRPLIPDGEASGLIVGYAVEVTSSPGRLEVSAGWPGRPHLAYLRSGTRRMPRRDPGSFRPQDRARALLALRDEVMKGGLP